MPTKETKPTSIIDSVMYSYSTSSNHYEEESRILKETINRLKEEIERFKVSPLMVCEIREMFGNNAIIKIPNGNQFLVNVSNGCEKLKSGESVLVEQKNLTVIKKVPITRRFNVEKFVIVEKPTVTWEEIGGLNQQIEEIKEVVALGILETLQTLASNRKFGYKVFEKWLGSVSKTYWKKMEIIWRDKSSLADVIRSER